MSTTTRTAIAALVLALALTGCTAAPEAPAAKQPAPIETEVAPLEADDAPVEIAPSEDDATYLKEVRIRVKGLTEATDEQLLAAAPVACAEFAKGVVKEDMRLVENETPLENGWYNDSMVIATWAAKVYCPEFAA